MTGQLIRNAIVTSSTSTSQQMEIPFGFTLVGVMIPVEVTSTTFTITHATALSGTFLTLKDPLGIYGTAGNAITFTIGATSLGIFAIPPSVSALLYSHMQVILGSSETAAASLIFKQIS